MAYRNIIIDGIEYIWQVGRSNIEIRAKNSNFKIIKARPSPQKRWGVITPDLDADTRETSFKIHIFTDPRACEEKFEREKDCSIESYKSQIEMVPLPSSTVSITSALISSWIRDAVR